MSRKGRRTSPPSRRCHLCSRRALRVLLGVLLLLVSLLHTGCISELPPEKSYSRTADWLTVVLRGAPPAAVAQAAWKARAGKLAQGLHLACSNPAPEEWLVSAELPAPPPPGQEEADGSKATVTIAAPLRCKAGAL